MKRRDFIKQAGCAAMGSTTLLSSLTNLKSFNGVLGKSSISSPNPNDYKALVCVLLAGGLDSYNLLIPSGTDINGDNGYGDYASVRTDLAIPQNELLALTGPLPNNSSLCGGFGGLNCEYGSFGVHPQVGGIRDLFDAGNLAFMSNIGTLVEPIASLSEYTSKKRPLGLYSHADQIMQWQTSVPQSRDALGVGGRLSDLLHAANSYEQISMNISLSGKNVFQRGKDYAEYSISNNINANNVGFEPVPTNWSNSGLLTQLRNAAVDSLVSESYANLLQNTYSATAKQSINSFDIFKGALQRVRSFTTPFPDTGLGNDMAAIAKVISVREQLGAKRQIFFVTIGGWDMHDDLENGLNTRLPQVSQALKAFYDATEELGIADKVTTFTISDFARTITSNGEGSDHAWGGNSIVMGGAVKGGKIYGSYPRMSVENYDRNVSRRGHYIPALSTDELYAELALWYGVSPYDLCYVLPNLGNFYSYTPNNYPVGFMDFAGTTISSENKPQGCTTY